MVEMFVLRPPILVPILTLLLTSSKSSPNLLKHPSLSSLPSLSQTIEKPTPSTLPELYPDVEIMDFYVPLHLFEGERIELSCGFKIIDHVKLHHIEWYRVTDTHQVRLILVNSFKIKVLNSFCFFASLNQDRE